MGDNPIDYSKGKVALLIDHENIENGIKESNIIKSQSYLSEILIQKAMDYGHIIISRAYLNVNNNYRKLRIFKKYGIEPINTLVYNFAGGVKSLADPKLICDAMELLYEEKSISTFVIVTGDKDFIPLIQKMAKHDKMVVIIGMELSTANALINECYKHGFDFYDYEELYYQKKHFN